MQIVIDIPEKVYRASQIMKVRYEDTIQIPLEVIANGTPLPRGHGRLKDIDAFINKVEADRQHAAYAKSWTADDVLDALDKTYAPTVVEAEFPLTDTE